MENLMANEESGLFEQYRILDDGFVREVDTMGDDTSIVQAARISYGKGTKKTSEDLGLIRYLMRHRHTTRWRKKRAVIQMRIP